MKKLVKIKKLYVLLLLPLIVATQCEDDDINSGFETEYIIQNDSSIDLILFSESNMQFPIDSQSNLVVGSNLNQITEPILPTESFVFNNIKLYKMVDDNFILAYGQDPIDDNLWVFNEPSENRYVYKLIITDNSLD
ncbi:hypothetical protein [Winogradskyella sp. R77965]|uniref:hypothetical protein n=1 Tax=Winogradskyella sp. R77965 TaxID=3093872 RepID=UPI0037DCF4B7